MLKINQLHVSVDGEAVLHGVDLIVPAGEVHVIMGPNGSGKSTLAQALAGNDAYEITNGSILFDGEEINDMSPDRRARRGMFLGFQYPVEIPGIETVEFLRAACNEQRRARDKELIDAFDFPDHIAEHKQLLGMTDQLLARSLNDGFSGGEKKRNELFQMLVLEPRLAILDETDSGLDIDALKTVAKGINAFRSSENALLLITHYQRILQHVQPDRVHVMLDGRIAASGDHTLAHTLEERGYAWVKNAQ